MSEQRSEQTPITVPRFMAAKQKGRKLALLTAYDALWARLLDQSGIDAILVGDSLGMVVQGGQNTLSVTLPQIIYHATCVARACQKALVIADMPFGSFQVSPRQTVLNAIKILKKSGAHAVKVEGGVTQADTISRMTDAEIPVMAHIGMRPQSVLRAGGLNKIQRDRDRILADAMAAQNAGAFGVVLELIPTEISKEITQALSIPTIGIGAGPDCDGQILVTPDMFGMTGFEPRFVKQFAPIGRDLVNGLKSYIEEVRQGTFPGPEHTHR